MNHRDDASHVGAVVDVDHCGRREQRTQTVTVRGRSLHVVERPGGAGRAPLLLCNGIGASLELLDPFVDQLDPQRPVIRFDVPGIGRSSKPVVPYRYPSLATTVRTVVDRLGYRGADVLGISWGGGLAQQLAFQYPRWCRRLVLVATAMGWTMVPAAPMVLARMSTPRRHRDAEYAARIAGDIYGGTAREFPRRASEALHDDTNPPSQRGYAYQMLAMAGWGSLPWLPLIRQRALVLAGDDDPLIPSVNATIMGSLLPRATVHRYHGGHLAFVTEADELAPVVDAFLDEH